MLHIYTRHAADCGHADDTQWRRCRCSKWLRGVLPNGATGRAARLGLIGPRRVRIRFYLPGVFLGLLPASGLGGLPHRRRCGPLVPRR